MYRPYRSLLDLTVRVVGGTLLRMRIDWTKAACDGQDPKYFFPRRGVQGQRDALVGRRICRACPIQRSCLEYSLTARVHLGGPTTQSEPPALLSGVWGATDAKHRAQMRRERHA